MTTQALAVVERTKQEIAERGIPPATWRTMTESLYPGANPASVLLVWDYCQARSLDPIKKPVHIVPMRVKVGEDWQWRDQILPGIYEYRITAHRTGEYLGHDEPEYGPEIEVFGVKAPEWIKFTVYRWNEKAKLKVPYTVKTYFREVCGTKKKDKNDPTLVANGRWERAPIQMLTKCGEAAPIREAFPEEIGGTPTVEEIEDHMPEVIDITGSVVSDAKAPEPPPGVTNFMKVDEQIRDACEKGFAALKYSAGKRLQVINKEFGALTHGAAYDEIGTILLGVLKDEYAAQQGRPRETSNAKKERKSESRADAAPAAASQGGGTPAPDTPVGVSAPAPRDRSGEEQPQTTSEEGRGRSAVPVTVTDIPWGGAKPATNPKDVSEYF